MKKSKTLQDLPLDLFEEISKKYRCSSFDHVEIQKFDYNATRKIQKLQTINGTELFAVIEHRDKQSDFYITATKPKNLNYADYKIFSVTGGFLNIPILSIQYAQSIGGITNVFYDYGDTAKYKILRFCSELQIIITDLLENNNYEECKIPANKEQMKELKPLFSNKEYDRYLKSSLV